MSEAVALSIPHLNGKELGLLRKCLQTGWVSSAGQFVQEFEDSIASYCKVKFATACINGTASLHVALRIVGVRENDEVIVPTLTFIATVNAVSYLNAHPVFMDCDDYYNIDVGKVEAFLINETVYRGGFTYNKWSKRRIAAILPVHVFGNAVDLNRLVVLARDRNIRVVEDATESLGTFYKDGRTKGFHAGAIGDVGCISFNGNKIITAGGGGALITNNKEYSEKARYLTTQARDEQFHYIHNEIGYNYRLSNLHAAFGLAQMSTLAVHLKKKRENYLFYKHSVERIGGLRLAEVPPYAVNNHWMYPMQIDQKLYGRNRDELMKLFQQEKIEVRPVWQLNHLQKPYKKARTFKIEKAYQMLKMTLQLPCSVNLSKRDILRIVSLLKKWKK